MSVSPYLRSYSTEELVATAERIFLLVERRRVVRLKPETGWILERAVRAYAARPDRDEIMKIICTVPNCDRAKGMRCLGKANSILAK